MLTQPKERKITRARHDNFLLRMANEGKKLVRLQLSDAASIKLSPSVKKLFNLILRLVAYLQTNK